MGAVRAGELDLLAVLFERHGRRLFGYLRGLLGSPSEAEDLVQETFLRLLRARRRYRRGAAFVPWMLVTARNLAWNRLEKGRRRGEEELPTAGSPGHEDTSDGPEAELAARQRAEALTRALQELGGGEREVLLLSYFEGLEHRDIAALLDISPGAVKARIHRARGKLRGMLTQEDDR